MGERLMPTRACPLCSKPMPLRAAPGGTCRPCRRALKRLENNPLRRELAARIDGPEVGSGKDSAHP